MSRFRKKPVVIEAIRLVSQVVIATPEGSMIGSPGDWLITGVAGEKYPCKDTIFRQTYEPADDCKCPRGITTCPGNHDLEGCMCSGDCDRCAGYSDPEHRK